jgi:hypothetical protein
MPAFCRMPLQENFLHHPDTTLIYRRQDKMLAIKRGLLTSKIFS